MSRKILLIALVIFLVGGNIACAPESEAITVYAPSVYDDYMFNEIYADSIYKNEVLIVYGEVGLVGRYRGGIAYLIFRHMFIGEGFFDIQMGGVLCEFGKKNETQLIYVTEGDYPLRVKGKCRGLEGLHVILEDCVIVD